MTTPPPPESPADDLRGVPFPAPEPLPPAPTSGSAERPRWGILDVILGFPFFLIMALVGLAVGVVIEGVDFAALSEPAATDALPIGVLALSLLFQQLSQAGWPWLVSKWKGIGFQADWRVYFKVEDIWLGFVTAVIGLAAAFIAGSAVSWLVDLSDEAEADNTQFLRDAEGSPWLYVMLFAVVVGAPVSEELFFRGLALRAFERTARGNKVVAVLASAFVFSLPHFIGTGWQGTAVLLSSIFMVGVVLAVAVYQTGRLGTAIVAHMMFNAVGAAGALGYFDQFVPS